ncbi:MAG: HAD-IC family P-type ATPase, partial [Clostridia bacterium]|nr:HAD-IC family P-type ATPase [Clostridia bacterium]
MAKKYNSVKQELCDRSVNLGTGLSAAQIQERKDKGYINDTKVSTSKTAGKIFVSNIFTFFNLLCFLVFLWILSVSESLEDIKNTTFMGVIIINTAIGIVQELKAKAKMDELSLLSSPDVKAIREGQAITIKLNEILMDDVINLVPGDQICTDSILVEGVLEVNESLLTGESLSVKKEKGDKLLSGSFVVSGKAQSRVEHVGADNYIQQLALKAKELGENKSELIRSIRLIMRIIGIIILPMAVLSFLNNLNAQLLTINQTANIFEADGGLFEAISHLRKFINSAPPEVMRLAYKEAVVYSAAAMIGMIPVGMFLLTSVALAVGIIRLAKKKALVQNFYSIEALARVNMLCLDKTGTITDGTMKVTEFIELRQSKSPYLLKDIISAMQRALDEDNMTARALREYFAGETPLQAEFTVPFSSDRKANAVRFPGIGLCVLGAPEYITKNLSAPLAEKIEKYQARGNRCLLFAINTTKASTEKSIPANSTPYALIVIEDNIKAEAAATIKLFRQSGVDVRVISGDNALTVSEVARRAGIENAEKYLSLQDVSDDEIRQKALDYTVFGRVNPAQKKLLIQLFKQAGKTVAMTGDGVNDILALKEADCSIAMANGSEATRNVAQLVLLDSDFGSMPAIVNEGRRVINNIERTSSLFLTKTMFSFLLLFCLIIWGRSYPIQPIQLTFTSVFVIGFASFVLALEPNNNKIKGSFVKNIMKNVLPPALSIVVSVLVIMALAKSGALSVPKAEYQTIITYTVFGIFLLVLYNISKPFNTVRKILLISVLGLGLGCALVMPVLPNQSFNLFKLSRLSSLVSFTLLFSVIFLA